MTDPKDAERALVEVQCAKIFEHKWLDPECVEKGCKSLAPPTPVATASGEARHLTVSEQQIMKRALRASSRLIAAGDEVPIVTADHTERARESKEATHQRYYDAFHAWFMSEDNGCDFWSECNAPEALATVAVEIHDAALTAAERATTDKIVHWLEARAIAIRDNGPKTAEGLLTGIAGAHVGALFDAARAIRTLKEE